MGRLIGYARVSTVEQNPTRQILSLEAAGVPRCHIFVEHQSGKSFTRRKYREIVDEMLQPGDCLVVHSLDRLGRDYHGIQDEWRLITREKGADIVVLDMPLLDTRKERNLMGSFIADLVLQVLSFCAQNERINIRERQRQGIEAAKARGVHLGRKAKPLPEGFTEMWRRYQAGEITQVQAALEMGLPRSSFRGFGKRIEQ